MMVFQKLLKQVCIYWEWYWHPSTNRNMNFIYMVYLWAIRAQVRSSIYFPIYKGFYASTTLPLHTFSETMKERAKWFDEKCPQKRNVNRYLVWHLRFMSLHTWQNWNYQSSIKSKLKMLHHINRCKSLSD